jgi:hypothetical protein
VNHNETKNTWGKFSIKENFEKQSSLMNFEILSWQSYICYWHSTQTFIPPYSVEKSCWNFQFVTIGCSAKGKTWMSIALVSKPGHWIESSGMTSKGIWAYLRPRPLEIDGENFGVKLNTNEQCNTETYQNWGKPWLHTHLQRYGHTCLTMFFIHINHMMVTHAAQSC